MKKRIFTFLLAGILTFGSISEGVCATQVSAGGEINTVTEKMETDIAIESADGNRGKRLCGYQRPIELELEIDELPEIYEESVGQTKIKGSAAYNSQWDSYSTNYYYNLLKKDEQRAFWNKLDNMCRGYLTGRENLTNIENYVDKESGYNINYCNTKAVVYSGLSEKEAKDTMYMFIFSNPQYYFLQILSAIVPRGSGGYAVLTIDAAFAKGATRASVTAQMQSRIDSWVAEINKQPTELLKEKKIHDLVCEKVEYDPYYGTFKQNMYNQTVYSVFFTDTTVCAGYAQAIQLLCNAVGIDCGIVTSELHEWNIVRLDNTWYYVDATWDDLSVREAAELGLNQEMGYKYFNRSADAYMRDEDQYSASMHKTESMWNGYLPELTYDSGATWEDYGTIYKPTVVLSAPIITVSENSVNITAPTGGTIYYTTDGTNPSVASTKAFKYTGNVTLNQSGILKAIAVANGYYDSSISETAVLPMCTVTFHANGGYIGKKSITKTTKKVTYGQKIGKLAEPKRQGYAFLGWYTKKSGGSEIAADTSAAGTKIYYARWAKIKSTKSSISSVKSPSSGMMVVKIKNEKTASGYQIRYSLKQNMSSARDKTVSKNSLTVNKLKKGKKYYVQVRMYQKESVSGKKTYGSWSKVKSVKIK